jgi:hypothetical protein
MKKKAVPRGGLPNFLYALFFLNQLAPVSAPGIAAMRRARTGPEFALQHKSVRTDRRF